MSTKLLSVGVCSIAVVLLAVVSLVPEHFVCMWFVFGWCFKLVLWIQLKMENTIPESSAKGSF